MPKSDPKQTLLRYPSWVTKVERGPKRLGPHPDSWPCSKYRSKAIYTCSAWVSHLATIDASQHALGLTVVWVRWHSMHGLVLYTHYLPETWFLARDFNDTSKDWPVEHWPHGSDRQQVFVVSNHARTHPLHHNCYRSASWRCAQLLAGLIVVCTSPLCVELNSYWMDIIIKISQCE